MRVVGAGSNGNVGPTGARAPVRVYIESGATASETLARVLDEADFLGHLRRSTDDADPPDVRIAIKPNMMATGGRPRDGDQTDPELVEALVAELRAHDYRRIAVVESRVQRSRTVADVARGLGYGGDGYEIIDLTRDTVAFEYGGVLGQQAAGRAWVEADFRISFAKNKADARYFFSGAMANVFGALPSPDKRRAYSGASHRPEECVRTALDAVPVAFGLVDAWQSRDGTGAVRQTGTILASASLFALDWVVGEKMEIDPVLNPILQEGLHRWGPVELERRGDLMAWRPWQSPSNVSVVAARLLDAARGGPWTIQ